MRLLACSYIHITFNYTNDELNTVKQDANLIWLTLNIAIQIHICVLKTTYLSYICNLDEE